MNYFFKKNKEVIIILIASFLIGGGIYFSNRKAKAPSSYNNIQKADNSNSSRTCINYEKAPNFIGEKKCVYGEIVKVYISNKENVFFDFCQDYKNCPFSAVIFKEDKSKFPNLYNYENKNVEIFGLIKTYQGRPEIIIYEPKQIEIK